MQTNSKTGICLLMQMDKGMSMTVLLTILLSLLVTVGCRKNEQPPSQNLDLQLVADNFVSPVVLLESPDSTHRLFVVDQVGKVWILDASGKRLLRPFIDISSKIVPLVSGYDERGLLGMAFHPDFKTNGKFYLFYTAPPPTASPSRDSSTAQPTIWNNMSRVSEFQVSAANPNQALLNSERIILEELHPQSNNNGGTIAFGPDGYLYISIGDGGNQNDIGPGHEKDWYHANAGGNGQDIEANLMGDILRIDINGSGNNQNYSIPPSNPFVGTAGRDEIYAYGFRNPYRFSFDKGDMQSLYVADVGQSLYEEINRVVKGGNYGWNVREGTYCFNAADETKTLTTCPDRDTFNNLLLDPVIEMRHLTNPAGGETVAIVGGFVYRGQDIPDLDGWYIFGGLSASARSPEGQIFLTSPSSSISDWPFQKITFASYSNNIGYWLKGFGQDLRGEIYILASKSFGPSSNSGKVFKLVVTGGSNA
ncbi:PQQ-dependent sugar dehydrogenase [Flavisolibacter tropicus]|nr:PQQ-dependent sugar dehydrogenase [Flavisolibacter tropicus]